MISQNKLEEVLNDYTQKTEEQILDESVELVLNYANESITGVGAYRDYLKKLDFNVNNAIKDIEQFEKLPAVDKNGYLKNYSRSALVLNDDFSANSWNISATSGSTGEPFYFPRNRYQDLVYAASADAYLKDIFNIESKNTLYINAFPMGIWIGGVFTMTAINEVMQKNQNLSLVNPGIVKNEVIRAVKNLSSEFDQIIIASYAPFLKDILDDGISQGVNWKEVPVKFIFSAEAFSEEFRDYLHDVSGIDPVLDTLNHYGTVDLGTMSHETPYSILIRRLAYKNKELFRELFNGEARVPTLTQFDPRLFYFEEVEGHLMCTAKTGYPLVRYDLKDKGGVRTKKSVEELFSKYGIDLAQEASAAGIENVWNLPFVFVYERADFSVSYYAFQVYPEVIRKALIDSRVKNIVTGKFTSEVVYIEGRQQLDIFVELRPEYDKNSYDSSNIQNLVHEFLLESSSEYRETAKSVGDDVIKPIIVLKSYEDLEYFKPGAKQKWVKK